MRRGLTLIELMIALAMSGFVVVAVASAYVTALGFEQTSNSVRTAEEARVRLEQRLTQLFTGAYVSSDANDTMTYFIGQSTGTTSADTGADSLTFTTTGEGINGAALKSEDDFTTQNERLGPQGGIAEVTLSASPTGSPSKSQEGLFLREQRPADGDPTQGGYESVLDPAIDTMTFEFYNGTEWDVQWDTQTGERRIPSAVRVTYHLKTGPDTNYVLVIRLPHSDISAQNPLTIGGQG